LNILSLASSRRPFGALLDLLGLVGLFSSGTLPAEAARPA
jgi:hypothetical protein